MTSLLIYDQLVAERGDPLSPHPRPESRHALQDTQEWTRPDDWDVELPMHGRRSA